MLGKARLDTGLKRGITRNEVAQLAGRFHFTPAYLQMLRASTLAARACHVPHSRGRARRHVGACGGGPLAFSPRRPATPTRSTIRLSGRLHFGLLRPNPHESTSQQIHGDEWRSDDRVPASISGLMCPSGCSSSQAKTLQRKRPPSSRRPYRSGGIASNFGSAAHLLSEVVSANEAILEQTGGARCDAHHAMSKRRSVVRPAAARAPPSAMPPLIQPLL